MKKKWNYFIGSLKIKFNRNEFSELYHQYQNQAIIIINDNHFYSIRCFKFLLSLLHLNIDLIFICPRKAFLKSISTSMKDTALSENQFNSTTYGAFRRDSISLTKVTTKCMIH